MRMKVSGNRSAAVQSSIFIELMQMKLLNVMVGARNLAAFNLRPFLGDLGAFVFWTLLCVTLKGGFSVGCLCKG